MSDTNEFVTLVIDKEAAGYLVDLLNAEIAGKITTDREPLGRVRLALDKIRFGDGPDAFRRQYLVKLPTTQPYPNFVRWTDHESIARAAAQQQEAGK
jgi:hypothetical protein